MDRSGGGRSRPVGWRNICSERRGERDKAEDALQAQEGHYTRRWPARHTTATGRPVGVALPLPGTGGARRTGTATLVDRRGAAAAATTGSIRALAGAL